METDNNVKGVSALGVSGMVKAYIGQKTLIGAWKNDLYTILDIFESLAGMCRMKEE